MVGVEAKVDGLLPPQIRVQYKAADAGKKRELVIKAIDEGVIQTGRTLSEIMELFPEDVNKSELVQFDDGKYGMIIFFKAVIPPPRPIMSSIQNGWYLHLVFSRGKVLINYDLSNIHKGISG